MVKLKKYSEAFDFEVISIYNRFSNVKQVKQGKI